MPTDNVSEPTEEARRAAEKYYKQLAGVVMEPSEAEIERLAQIIESETRCGEMRKALRDAQGMIAFLCCCIHSGESLSAEDERTVDNVIKAIRNALNGGPANDPPTVMESMTCSQWEPIGEAQHGD